MKTNTKLYIFLIIIATIASTTVLPDIATADDNTDVMKFMNKDNLHGTMLSADPDSYGLRWQHENVTNPIDFSLTTIDQIKLAKRPSIDLTNQDSLIKLTNDDILIGKIISLNNEQLILNTYCAGKVTIQRSMIKEIKPQTNGDEILYEGPASIDEWHTKTFKENGEEKSAWIFKNNALYARQSSAIGKNIDNLPNLVSIEFKVTWISYPAFYFALFTDNLEQYYGSNCYMLQVNNSSMYLQRYTKNSGSKNLGSINYTKFSNNPTRHATFTMLIDKNKKSISMLIDHTLVKQWIDIENFITSGNGILFQPQQTGNMKLSEIKISQWNGELPISHVKSQELEHDLLRFANNDKVSGTLIEISDENVKFKTTYAELPVPLASVMNILMSTENATKAKHNTNDIRLNFFTKSIITLQLTKIDAETITGNSENFGTISVPIGALKSLEFNIHEEKDDIDDKFNF